jgi:ParB-like chromosome segregation protein Spo0J
MLIRTVDINELHESEFNPRIKLEKTSKEYQQIAASIQEFGFVEPLVVNEHNMCVIGGHQRLQVLKDSGAIEVECVMINETDPEREKALCVALNKIKGDWDMEKLAFLLGDDDVSVFPTGFDEGEVDLEKYLKDTEPVELPDELEEQAEPEADEKETTTVIKIGGFSFTVKASEYYALIDDIRDNGIFEPAEIRAELQRRILND